MDNERDCSSLNREIERIFYYKEFPLEVAESLLEKAEKLFEKQLDMLNSRTSSNNKIILSWNFITLKANIDALKSEIIFNKLSYDRDGIFRMNFDIELELMLEHPDGVKNLENLFKEAENLFFSQCKLVREQFPLEIEAIWPPDLAKLGENIELLKYQIEQERPKTLIPGESARRQRERNAVAHENSYIDGYRQNLRDRRNLRNEAGVPYYDDSPMSRK